MRYSAMDINGKASQEAKAANLGIGQSTRDTAALSDTASVNRKAWMF